MRRLRSVVSAFAFLILVFTASRADAIPIVVDTFEDGTTMGWFVPDPTNPVPPENVATGGPAGAGDSYLELESTGQPGPGGRLSVLNESQWTGNYLAAGIIAIAMDVNNFGPDEVTLRLLFEDFDAPGPPANLVTTLTDIVVPANSGWMSIVFDLSAANLIALLGSVDEALSEVDVLRLFHNPDATFPGPPIGPPRVAVTLGVDNIRAIRQVPEPATAALLVGGMAAALLRARRSRRTKATKD
jgi:hypothetical protein